MVLDLPLVSEEKPQKSNEWYTPPRVIAAARCVMGGIDLDPASCKEANQIVRAPCYYTKEDDGLMQPWYGRVWLNPPYSYAGKRKGMESGDRPHSLMKRWIAKLIAEYQAGNIEQAILLTKADPKQNWFAPLWDFPLCFARDRIYFHRPSLEPEKMMFGTCFVYLGAHEEAFIDAFQKFGRIVKAIDAPKDEPRQNALWEASHDLAL